MGEVADWRKALVEAAKKQSKQESGGNVKYVSLAGGCVSLDGAVVPEGKMHVIVLADVTCRTMYDRPYDKDDNGPPDCFALGTNPKELTPHANVPDPVSDKCDHCPKAEFGTALQGKGPACKTRRRLIMIPATTDADQVPEAEMAQINIPPTSVVNWSKYAALVSGRGLPTWAVSTHLTGANHPKKQIEVTFKPGEPLNEAVTSAVHGLIDVAQDIAMRPYTYEDEG
jgi:hypothetical protein